MAIFATARLESSSSKGVSKCTGVKLLPSNSPGKLGDCPNTHWAGERPNGIGTLKSKVHQENFNGFAQNCMPSFHQRKLFMSFSSSHQVLNGLCIRPITKRVMEPTSVYVCVSLQCCHSLGPPRWVARGSFPAALRLTKTLTKCQSTTAAQPVHKFQRGWNSLASAAEVTCRFLADGRKPTRDVKNVASQRVFGQAKVMLHRIVVRALAHPTEPFLSNKCSDEEHATARGQQDRTAIRSGQLGSTPRTLRGHERQNQNL